MSANPPPSNNYSGATYNSQNFSSTTNGNYALLDESNTFTQNQFCTASISQNSAETLLVTKGYIDQLTFPALGDNNVWTGQNQFNYLPTSSQTATSSTQLIKIKAMVILHMRLLQVITHS